MVKNNVRYAQLSFYFLFWVQRRSKMRTCFYFDKSKIADNQKTLAIRNTSIWQYISSETLIGWPYQNTFLHKNCIVRAYLNLADKIYKIVKYKSNIQKCQNQKLLEIYKIIKVQVKS